MQRLSEFPPLAGHTAKVSAMECWSTDLRLLEGRKFLCQLMRQTSSESARKILRLCALPKQLPGTLYILFYDILCQFVTDLVFEILTVHGTLQLSRQVHVRACPGSRLEQIATESKGLRPQMSTDYLFNIFSSKRTL